ncbi:MAG: acyl carrier protein [Bdellovibrionales bacterium]
MTDKKIDSKVRELIALVLDTSIPADAAVTRDSEPRWTSLKQVELIFALEDAFSTRFSEKEMPELKSIAAIIAALEKHRATV